MRDRYLAQALESCDPRVREWLGDARIEALLGAELDEALARRSDQSFAEKFAGWCPRPGCEPSDYLHREIEAAGGTALVGIRFKGGDVTLPFVDLLARDFAHDDASRFEAQLAACKAAFAPFEPLWLRIHEGSQQYAGIADGVIDQRYVAGRLSELGSKSALALPDGLRLVASRLDEDYAEYERTFDALSDEMPELAPELSKSSREELEDCARHGALLTLKEADRFAGLIAATQGDAHGLSGYYVVEEVLARPFRGRRLGPCLQAGLVDVLRAREHEYPEPLLFGTIHGQNEASLRTAKAIGRDEVSRYRMFALR